MAELVTGYAGTEHITSEQVGLYNAGTVGAGKYILDTADGLACTIVDANTLQIAAGDALFEGRHVTVQSPETLTISSGTMGMNRIDLVVIHYERDGGGIETATLEILEGTPTSSTPAAPTIPAGSILDGDADAYMAIWSVRITGLTPQTPTALADSVTPTAAYRDAIAVDGSNNVTLAAGLTVTGGISANGHPSEDGTMERHSTNTTAGSILYQRNAFGFEVTLSGIHVASVPAVNTSLRVAQNLITSYWRPAHNVYGPLFSLDTPVGMIFIDTNGTINIRLYTISGITTSSALRGTIAWMV